VYGLGSLDGIDTNADSSEHKARSTKHNAQCTMRNSGYASCDSKAGHDQAGTSWKLEPAQAEMKSASWTRTR
jgi:hypothetical protein